MGRNVKVTAEEVLETIEHSHRITKGELAEVFDVCPDTIRSRMKELRASGEHIIFDKEGYFSLSSIETEDDLESLRKFMEWEINTIAGLADCGQPVREIIKSSRIFLNDMPSRKRKALSQFCGLIKGLADHIEIQKELEE